MMGRMSLAQVQDALATIVTDGEVERVYLRTPGEAIAAVADTAARDALGHLEVADVVRYARGLRRKRWDDLSATWPLSVRSIAGLHACYDAWLAAHPPRAQDTLLPPGPAEALRAMVDLVDELRDDPGEAPWAAELLVFETLAACSRADDVPRGLQSQYAIHAIVDELNQGLVPIDPPPEPHAYAFAGNGVRWKKLGG
jgi:hypothetical protein